MGGDKRLVGLGLGWTQVKHDLGLGLVMHTCIGGDQVRLGPACNAGDLG